MVRSDRQAMMPKYPLCFDAQASGLSVKNNQLANAELNMPDRIVPISRVNSLETRWRDA